MQGTIASAQQINQEILALVVFAARDVIDAWSEYRGTAAALK